MVFPGTPAWQLPCPVCVAPLSHVASACPNCGLPAAGRAAEVVARIGATLADLARDRDSLLATLRAAAPGTRSASSPPAPATAPAPTAWVAAPPSTPAPPPPPRSEPPWAFAPLAPQQPAPRSAPKRRLSPQQVLLALGAVLLVVAAIAFVAVAWTRLGLVFQALAMVTVTSLAVAASAFAARRGLRATEEALAATAAALLAIDLGAAHAFGLLGADAVPLRLWTALSCALIAAVAVLLRQLTPSTLTWPLVALLAAQPAPFLLLPGTSAAVPAAVGLAFVVAALDLAVALRLRPAVAGVARVLAGSWVAAGAVVGLGTAWTFIQPRAWTAAALLLLVGLVLPSLLPVLRRVPAPTGWWPATTNYALVTIGLMAGVAGLALTGALNGVGLPGPVIAAGLSLGLLTAAVLVTAYPEPMVALTAAGIAAAATGGLLLADEGRLGVLGLVVLAGTIPAALAAWRLPGLRVAAVVPALLLPAASVLLARADGRLGAPVAGLLLALLAATAFALAAARAGHADEVSAALCGPVSGAAAALTGSAVGAWGQVALQLSVVGVAAGCYALVSGRRLAGVLAIADLVAACWIALGGASVETPEAYTLPAAAGLALIALPGLRAGARSWAAEGPAVAVALVPSALVVLDEPSALRLILVVAAAVAATVVGVQTHRQAPFVIGAAVLTVVVLGRLTPFYPLVPSWVSLGTAGLLLLVVGATYERRLQQAREAVAWVTQMR